MTVCDTSTDRLPSRIVPNYELAPDLEKVKILLVVVRENMSEEVRMPLTSISLLLICANHDAAHRPPRVRYH